MKMKIRIRSLIPVCMALAVHTASAQVQPVDYVDMFMGNRGESNCGIGPQLPHGSVNPSPQTPGGGNDGYDPLQPIRGFGQLHVSGTGWGRYGQILLSPQVGFSADEQGHDSPKSGESALPYYYAVTLDRYGIRTELAPTHNAAIYRFSFPAAEDANILLDIAHNIPQHIKPEIGGRFLGGAISYDPETGIIGGWGSYRGGFGSGAPYKVYFAAALDRAPRSVAVTDDGDGKLYARIALPPFDAPGTVLLKIAVSLRSESNARKFLAEQIPGHDFEKVKAAARETWNRRLNSIQIDTESETAKKIFYTALYHSFLMARDRTGDNPHTDSDTPHMDDHYCIWDTWRTKYPLMTLLNESYVARSINSFIERFERTGACQPTYTSSLEWEAKQGGDDVDNVIVDAWLKGVEGVDWTRAYRIVRFHALNTRSHEYLRLGWQPETGSPMSCSAALEYAYNDYCASLMAEGMGDHETARMLSQRSCSWEKLFDTSLESDGFKGFVAPRKENGQWISIDPKKTYGSWVEYFYEGNSWVYSLFAPHQFDRLAELCGGPRRTVERLEHGFSRKLIDLNNEPGFLAPYIFTHCSRADLTSKYVAQIRDTQFSLERGYPGNEDSGAMGAWYVFTSVGLFPNAGQDLYYLVSPQFERSVLTTERGARIVIEAKGLSRENRYIGSVTLNGRSLGRAWLRHGEIADGAHIVLTMSSVPNPFESGVKPEGGKTVIVQLSDPQFGYWSDNREMTREIEACGEAVRRINRLKPDLVVVTGDLVNRYDDAEQWRAFDSVISGLDKQIKVVCLPGNHDQKISGDKVDCTVFKEHYGADRFALALKGNLLLGINSSYIKHCDPEQEPAQKAWLEEQLGKSDAKVKILFTHHPFFLHEIDETDGYPVIGRSQRHSYFELFERGGLKAVYAGHLHGEAQGNYNGIEMTTTAATGKPLCHTPSGIRVITISGTEVRSKYYPINRIPEKTTDL